MSYLQIKNYEKILKGKKVLYNINMEMELGKVYGIQGHNGCGKTMLLRAVSGLITGTSGEIVVNGKKLKKEIDFPPDIGVLIENPEFWKHSTGYQVLKMLAEIRGKIGNAEIEETISRVGLSEMKDVPLAKYSLGMKQRLGIAQAVMEKPDILLLDEPTNALDQSGLEIFRHIIETEKERNVLIVIVSHDKTLLYDICDEVITMENGTIISREESRNVQA